LDSSSSYSGQCSMYVFCSHSSSSQCGSTALNSSPGTSSCYVLAGIPCSVCLSNMRLASCRGPLSTRSRSFYTFPHHPRKKARPTGLHHRCPVPTRPHNPSHLRSVALRSCDGPRNPMGTRVRDLLAHREKESQRRGKITGYLATILSLGWKETEQPALSA
jgi:hypothetical protein